MLVRGGEHHARRPACTCRVAGEALGQLQAIQAGHLDVEEGDVGRQFVDQAQRIEAIGGAPGDAQFGPDSSQLAGQVVEQVRFVVGNQGADGFDGGTVGLGSIGSSRREVTPPLGFSINCT
jgi:hypothetical protein